MRVAEARPRPRSALLRFTLALGIGFAALGVAGSLVMRETMLRDLDRELRRSIEGEAARMENLLELRDLRSYVLDRIRGADAEAGFRYLLVEADGSCPMQGANDEDACPIGNLAEWPQEAPDADGWLRFAAGGPMLGRGFGLRQDRRVLVARSTAGIEALRADSRRVILLLAAAMLAAGGLVGIVAARHLLGRIDRLNRFLDAVAAGDLDRRLPESRRGDEFDALAGGINRMLGDVAHLMRTVEHVSEHAAHDLMTPLSRTRLAIERAAEAPDATVRAAALARALAEIDRLQASFTALLEIARNEAGGTAGFVPCDLAAVAREALEPYAILAEDRGLSIEAALAPAKLPGIAPLLRLMLENLLHNALKFSPPGGTIRLATGTEAGAAWLSLADQGPGIPAAMRGRVFDRFVVGEPGAARSGTGLGLALVRAIAGRHGLAVSLGDAGPGLLVRLQAMQAGAARHPDFR